jgi:precorrin-6B C5,15-methyltransferase / cobalt-precorrin-6B C5,C15-methyltransferase
VFGGKRHLALAAALIRGAARPWPSPFDRAADEVLAQRGRPVCVLASGDPFVYGVGTVLARHVDPAEMLVVPAPSAFSLAAARLGWALPDTTQVSLHGRALDLVRPHLQPGRRVLALTSDRGGPAELARLLSETGFGASPLIVLEALGGKRERIRATTAAKFDLREIDDLNVVAIEAKAAPGARVIARAAGLPDAMFEHDGQITKREIRAMTLSSLAPRRGELLWDIGAGSASVAIEWMLADPSLRAIAIERRPDRAARIRRNAAVLGVPGLEVVEGEAPEVLTSLPKPDAIFIGGGANDALDAARSMLRVGGRLVVNAVTLETEGLLLARYAALGGELTRLAVTRADAIDGEKRRPAGANPSRPPCGEGSGVGVGPEGTAAPNRPDPPPHPSPSRNRVYAGFGHSIERSKSATADFDGGEGAAGAPLQIISAPIGWRPAMPVTQWTWIKP